MWIVVHYRIQEVYEVRWLSVSGYKFSKYLIAGPGALLVKQLPIDQSKFQTTDATKLFHRGQIFPVI